MIRESRTFDIKTGQTSVLRTKETAVGYRYTPEPSLPPLTIGTSLIEQIKSDLEDNAVLPSELRKSLRDNYDLELDLIADLMDVSGLVKYFMV